MSVAMEEYEIRDVMNRKHNVNLNADELLIREGASQRSGDKLVRVEYSLGFQVRNIGSVIEHNYCLEIHIPSLLYHQFQHDNPLREHLIRTDDENSVFSVNGLSPIFQYQLTTIVEGGIGIDRETIDIIKSKPIKVILFYSNGTIEKLYKMDELLIYKGDYLVYSKWNQ